MNIYIRPSELSDLPIIHELIVEFSIFQKTPEKVKITLEQMIKDQNDFKCMLALSGDKILGFSSYYFAYHSWTGKVIYLDDLYVRPEYRGQKIGDLLFDAVKEIGLKTHCVKMKWMVSNWNKMAQDYYRKKGASIENTEWICDLEFY